MKIRVKTVDRDKGFEALRRLFVRGVGSVDVGVSGAINKKVPVYAAVHEFGYPAGGIPQRSFIRSTIDENALRYRQVARDEADRLVMQAAKRAQPDERRALSKLGAVIVKDIKAKIESNISPPLQQATIDRKGHAVALIDKGDLLRSVTFRTRLEGEK
jgi:hypothetical protein